ncbi:MAG: Tol-Pal system beta propeller repeat protein TolB [Calditrichia bacterium]
MNYRLLFLLAFIVGITAAQAQNDVYLRTESKYFTRLPVLLKPVLIEGRVNQTVADDILRILDTDLWYSSVIDPRQEMASAQSASGSAASPAENMSIRYSVSAKAIIQGDKLELTTEILDRTKNARIGGKTYKSCPDKLRLAVHTAADDIVEMLTGEQGIARSRVAYTVDFNASKEIFLIDYDSHNRRQLTKNRSLNLTPAWLMDGTQVLLTSYVNKNPDLFTIATGTGEMKPLIRGESLTTSAAISPDGKKVAFVSTRDGNAEIYVMDSNGKNPQRITRHWSIDTSPDWSPNSREIIFTSDRLGKPQLFIMDAEGSNLRRLDTRLDYCGSPSWSPKGDKIAFVARENGRFNIFTYDVLTQSVARLTQNAGSNEDPDWSPNGFQLVFSSTRDRGRDIYQMNWDGSQLLRLTFTGNCSSPSWSPNQRPDETLGCN